MGLGGWGRGSISEDDNADCLRLTIISEGCISWVLSQRRNDKKTGEWMFCRRPAYVSCGNDGEGNQIVKKNTVVAAVCDHRVLTPPPPPSSKRSEGR